MRVFPDRFDSDLEAEFLASRTPDRWALLRWSAAAVAPQYLLVGLWDEMIDPGSFDSTWPIRLSLTVSFLVFLAAIWSRRSVDGARNAWWVAYAISAVGLALILDKIDGGYTAGVGGFIVPVGLVALSLSHLEAIGGLGILVGIPLALYWLQDATTVEILNLAVWLLIGAGFAYVAYRVTDATRRRAFLAERGLEAERDKVDTLIRKIVPEPIADRLESGEETISDRLENVTVLFADIVGFTRYSEAHEPELVVGQLNELFSKFDALVTRSGLDKIKTIGDGYMVAGGALPGDPIHHAESAARLAIDMRSETLRFCKENGVGWDLRIGIHTGPLVAGVIGTDRYAYDMWGDTVNVASRLESHGNGGEIHISAAVAEQLGDEFRLESCGPITVKNRGPVDAYRLLQYSDAVARSRVEQPDE